MTFSTMQTSQAGEQRQATQGNIDLAGLHSTDVISNTSTTPNVLTFNDLLQAGYAARNSMPNVNPPSESEITEQMWLASGVIGLIGAMISGNAAGGIAAGMVAALGVHDQGYALRQRGESVMELHSQGYSKRAIENWYETGDNKELDKERDNMDRMASEQFNADQANARQSEQMKQQRDFHEDEMKNARLSREQTERNANRSYNLQLKSQAIAQQNADSNRMEAIAKMGNQAGGVVGQTAAESGQPHLQNASFDPSKVPLPAGSDQWSDREKAAYINAAGQAYHAEQLKQVLHQEAAAKNLRTSESQQTAMFDKILTAAQKVNQTPNNKAGDEQLLMQFQVGESPNVSPRTTQIKPLMQSMNTGFWDNLYGGAKGMVGQGLTDSEREQARELTRENATAQAQSHMEHVQNVVTTGGYDLSNPQVMADMVAAFHVSPQTIIGLANGTLSPQDAAQQAIDKVSPRTTNFADVKSGDGKQKPTSGSW